MLVFRSLFVECDNNDLCPENEICIDDKCCGKPPVADAQNCVDFYDCSSIAHACTDVSQCKNFRYKKLIGNKILVRFMCIYCRKTCNFCGFEDC